MIRVAIVEDDRGYQTQLKGYLGRYEKETGQSVKVTAFSSGQEIAYGYAGGYDIILMDIELGAVSGMEAAEIIRRSDPDVAIIFITHSPQYAIRGYAVQALDYVLKPISYYAFAEKMSRAVERMNRKTRKFILLSLGKGEMRKVDVASILYVEVQEHILIYHTDTASVTVSGSMREAEDQLAGYGFFRIHKGFLVNLEHVRGIRNETVVVGGDELQISRSRKKAFLDALNDHINEVG